jgi:hypothetical protein
MFYPDSILVVVLNHIPYIIQYISHSYATTIQAIIPITCLIS